MYNENKNSKPQEYTLFDFDDEEETKHQDENSGVGESFGASVDLKDRAEAIATISDQLAHESQMKGAQQQLYIKNSAFRRGYKNPEDIYYGMEEKQEAKKALSKEALKRLSASEDLIKAGFTPEEVALTEEENNRIVMRSLRSMDSKERKKLVKKITPK